MKTCRAFNCAHYHRAGPTLYGHCTYPPCLNFMSRCKMHGRWLYRLLSGVSWK